MYESCHVSLVPKRTENAIQQVECLIMLHVVFKINYNAVVEMILTHMHDRYYMLLWQLNNCYDLQINCLQ